MNKKIFEFDAKIMQNEDIDAAYIEVPIDIKKEFGKGRLLVTATYDGIEYKGQVVKMGLPCYVIGVTKELRKKLNKTFGDIIHVTIQERCS